MRIKKIYGLLIILFLALCPATIFAMKSANYGIPIDSMDSSGGANSSASFSVIGTAGDSFASNGDGADYGAEPSLNGELGFGISMELDSVTKNLGNIIPGNPIMGTTAITVNTDASGGYDLSIFQDRGLTHDDGSTEIPGYSCSIEEPCAWNGYGLGFTVQSGSDVETKWSGESDYHYAAIPDAVTIFHTKNGFSDSNDNTAIGYKINVPIAQKAGGYSNTVTYIATTKI